VSRRTPLFGAAGVDQIDSCRFRRPGWANFGFIIHRKSGLFWSGLVKFGQEGTYLLMGQIVVEERSLLPRE
jgi:hypothetical protein